MDIHINRNGEQHGPYPEASAREMLAAGQLQPTDMAWHAGADGWKPLSEVLGATAQPPATPPPTPTQSATPAADPPSQPQSGGLPKRHLAGSAPDEVKPSDDEPEDSDKISVTRKGEAIGPYSRDKAKEYFAAGQLLPTDWGWHEGMDEWKPLPEVLGMEVSAGVGAAVSNTGYTGTSGTWTVGDCLGEGWRSFKGNLGGALLLIFGMWVLSPLVLILPIGVLIAAWFVSPYLVLLFPFVLLGNIGPYIGGFCNYFIKQVRNEGPRFGDLFSGYKTARGPLFLLPLVLGALVILASLWGLAVMLGAAGAAFASLVDNFKEAISSGSFENFSWGGIGVGLIGILLGMLVGYLVPFILIIYGLFSVPLAIDRKLGAWGSIKTSMHLVQGQWWKVFLLLFVINLICTVIQIPLGIIGIIPIVGLIVIPLSFILGLFLTGWIASVMATLYVKNVSNMTAAHTGPLHKNLKIMLIVLCGLPPLVLTAEFFLLKAKFSDIGSGAASTENAGGRLSAEEEKVVGFWDKIDPPEFEKKDNDGAGDYEFFANGEAASDPGTMIESRGTWEMKNQEIVVTWTEPILHTRYFKIDNDGFLRWTKQEMGGKTTTFPVSLDKWKK